MKIPRSVELCGVTATREPLLHPTAKARVALRVPQPFHSCKVLLHIKLFPGKFFYDVNLIFSELSIARQDGGTLLGIETRYTESLVRLIVDRSG